MANTPARPEQPALSLFPRRPLLRLFRLVHRAGRWVRRHLTPAGQVLLGATLTAGALGVDTRQSLAYQVFALGAALLLCALVLAALQRGRITVRRRLPALATAGQPFTYSLQLQAAGFSLAPGGAVMDELTVRYPSVREYRRRAPPGQRPRRWLDRKWGYPRFVELARHATGAAVPEVPLPADAGGAATEVRVTATPLRRGLLHFEQTRLARPEVLGLVRSLHRAPAPGRLLVLPRRYRVPPLDLPGQRREQPGGVAFSGHVGESEEFVATRDYRPGDPVRRIHWRGWARIGRPVVREYQDEFFVRHALVLDTFTTPSPAFEEAVSVAASYVVRLPGADNLLDLVFVGDRPHRLTTGRGTGGEQHLLEALACLEAACPDRISVLADVVVHQAPRASGMVLVLTGWDAARRELVERLRGVGTAVAVLVVAATERIDAGPLADAPHRLWHLRPGQVQEDLDRGPLGGREGAPE